MTAFPENDVYCVDCIEGMQRIPSGTVDLVFADPPFNIGYQYDIYRDELDDEEYLNWCERWTHEVARRVREAGNDSKLKALKDCLVPLPLPEFRAFGRSKNWSWRIPGV